ncbi:bifunctional peptidase and arginyl-hydroxylase JMJD5-like [Anneissia japonica]|uniref:bifunctional peptidase and arginyl-hydroxylase JMJD5-like n=1 Tax=Anneissia japonica TaxID=1529436 RepID=UPI001425B3EC|nr:bifunctional peptidase and arginyl-hydroxylase JMJD5-like [Anneissia japonica]
MDEKFVEIEHISAPSVDVFKENFLLKGIPVVITDVADKWPAANWTLDLLCERAGDNVTFVRQNTNSTDYRAGKVYKIRESTLREYINDIKAKNNRSINSYLAVQNIKKAFPQIQKDVPIPGYVGKVHGGPFMWIARKGHYEYCHFDPDDGLLVMLKGRKRVKLFGCDLTTMYPNPLGSKGKTVQAEVNCDDPDLKHHPNFCNAVCYECVLHPGQMLFIPAFWWHQVTSIDVCISVNYFFGDSGENIYLSKIMKPPQWNAFSYWLLNIVEQNKEFDSFQRVLANLPKSLPAFLLKLWHEIPNEGQVDQLVSLIMDYLGITELPEDTKPSKHPPILKIRGLLWRS